MRLSILLASALLLSACATSGRAPVAAHDAAPSREHFAPPGWEASYHNWHYTPVLKVGEQVIVSGIPAALGATYEDKVRGMFVELQRHLEAAGASMADVVELTTWHVGATSNEAFRSEFRVFAKVHAEFFRDHYPAWSAVGTTALLSPDAVVEMRAVAVVGSGRAPRADIPTPAPRPAASP